MKDLSKVREFIVDNLLYGEGDALTEDASFQESGIVDSTGMLELIFFLEETYKIKISDEELIPENIDSLKNISRFLGQKLSTGTTIEI